MSIIYFISDGEFLKIGITSGRVKNRIVALQTGNPKKLSIISSVSINDELSALKIERIIHSIFKEHRASGEWFLLHNVIGDISSINSELDIILFLENNGYSCDDILADKDKIIEIDLGASGYSLTDYITINYSGSQTLFAEAQAVQRPQVTQWIKKEFIVIDDVLYSKRRELKNAKT